MGGLALLAREAGFTVTGSDQNVYPHEYPAGAAGYYSASGL